MPSTSFVRLLFATVLWLIACAPLAAAEPSGGTEAVAVRLSTPHNLNFFEKTALKIAARKLRKALKKQPWAEMPGDSTTPCGQILLQNGRVIEAELTDITPTEVKYRPCGQPDYPKFVLSKKDVLRVVGADGQNRYEDSEAAKKAGSLTPAHATNHQAGVASAALGIAASLVSMLFFQSLGLALLLGLAAMVLGFVAFDAIKKHPEKHKGAKWASIGLILGGLTSWIALLALASDNY